MQSNSSRAEILQRIADAPKRQAAILHNANNTDAVYKPIQPNALECFISELEAISGKCVLCEDEADVYVQLSAFVKEQGFTYIYCLDESISAQLKIANIPFSSRNDDFIEMKAGITRCEILVARTGSIIMTSVGDSGRQMNVFPPVHIVIAKESQIVNYPEDALVAIQNKYGHQLPSTISTITGPSRTADIEKTLVLGAHGPKEFVVFLSKG